MCDVMMCTYTHTQACIGVWLPQLLSTGAYTNVDMTW